MRIAFILPSLLVLSMFACKKPHLSDIYGIDAGEPVVFKTLLSDSLPPRTFSLLGVNDVEGVSVKYVQENREVRYFEYQGESDLVLAAITKTPFSKNAAVADTNCREVSSNDLLKTGNRIAESEKNAVTFFWSIDPTEYEVFECIKPLVKHTLLIHKDSNRILHRIEFLAS